MNMSFTFLDEEYADMHFVSGLCCGNANAAIEEYHQLFP
jgi:hypothetical protein